jgi:hypothetical protein
MLKEIYQGGEMENKKNLRQGLMYSCLKFYRVKG